MEASRLVLGLKSFIAERSLQRHHSSAHGLVPLAADARESSAAPSARLIGLFQDVAAVQHPHLARYLSAQRVAGERVFVVSEHYTRTLELLLQHGPLEEAETVRLGYQIASALVALRRAGLVCRTLSARTVLLTPDHSVKLADWGLHAYSSHGTLVPFPVASRSTLAPEAALLGPEMAVFASDVWAWGALMVEMLTGQTFWGRKEGRRVEEAGLAGGDPLIQGLVELVRGDSHTPDQALAMWDVDGSRAQRLLDALPGWAGVSAALRGLVSQCLKVDPMARPTIAEVCRHPLFRSIRQSERAGEAWELLPRLRCTRPDEEDHGPSPQDDGKPPNKRQGEKPSVQAAAQEFVSSLTLDELFYFWNLAGGSVADEYHAYLRRPAAIRRMRPGKVVRAKPAAEAGVPVLWFRGMGDAALDSSDDIVPIVPQTVEARIHAAFEEGWAAGGGTSASIQRAQQSYAEREADFAYQVGRVRRYKRLLSRMPEAAEELLAAARGDIPPCLRGRVWCQLLGVGPVHTDLYHHIDKEAEGPADRQILLDIPRCHQYNKLLSSPLGHLRLRRVLKAWVFANPQLAYWQGLDSLLAPLLVHNFGDEATAFGCLLQLTARHMGKLLLPNNSVPLREHLLLFRQILAFHDPALAVHLADHDFHAELFAIPWFLTLFAHVFPLDKVFWLWDQLLAHPPQYVFLIAVALMMHVRTEVLARDFNDLVLFFTNLPDVDLHAVLAAASKLYRTTMPSLLTPRHFGELKQFSSLHSSTDSLESSTLEVDPTRWWEQPTPLDAVMGEIAPRIELEDVISAEPPLLVVDIRSQEAYTQGSLASAIRNPSPAVLSSARAIVLLSSSLEASVEHANQLVRSGTAHVCVLNGGMDVIRRDAPKLFQPPRDLK